MEIITLRFLQKIDSALKEKGIWMSEVDKIFTVKKAISLFLTDDYDQEDSALEAAISLSENKAKDFNLKISFHNGNLLVDYCDGSDKENYQIKEIDDIWEKIQEAVISAGEISSI